MPLHTPPSEAVAEIDALYDVYLDVQEKWGSEVSSPPLTHTPWPWPGLQEGAG